MPVNRVVTNCHLGIRIEYSGINLKILVTNFSQPHMSTGDEIHDENIRFQKVKEVINPSNDSGLSI
ncbi:hypothetical protein SAMN05421594_1683 [Chryseobacterium oleae]|uniref:Uncharacterized protein n=1 Tax=Chryseobacterium oleae TaxID=491207 RepID=A0A1I4XC33_CHROL|nr:hypothetical protein SAMN05421594_1683 [Chryseobacterium oleae]